MDASNIRHLQHLLRYDLHCKLFKVLRIIDSLMRMRALASNADKAETSVLINLLDGKPLDCVFFFIIFFYYL